jgi:hypothetical protein
MLNGGGELMQGDSGCTVGVVRIPGGLFFFKNRDLSREHLANRLMTFESTPDSYVLRGINLVTGDPEGVSIGVNRYGICVANTHVVSTRDVTYDLLCEEIVRQARHQSDPPRIVADFVKRMSVQGGRILVASREWAFLIEVYEAGYRIAPVEGDFVMTNTFSLLPHLPYQGGTRERSSLARLQAAQGMIVQIGDIGALKSMLRSHIPERGELSICNHRLDGGGTESSHIIQLQGEVTTWSWLAGYPCENEYATIQLFGSACLTSPGGRPMAGQGSHSRSRPG